jgi:L-iditol 2-dehydrogenase
MPNTMRAVVFYGAHDMRLEEVPLPVVPPDWALVRVRACGICPTDLRKFTGSSQVPVPIILGHEAAGDIVEIGDNPKDLKPGDRVAVNPGIFCYQCYYCQRGLYMRCEHEIAIGGAAESGDKIQGAFSQYLTVPTQTLVPLTDHVSYAEATFGDPLAAALNSIRRRSIDILDSVVIVGAGPLGLLHVQLAQLRGAEIMVSEPVAARRELALRYGAHHVIDPTGEDAVARVRALTGGRGADVVIVAVGSPKAEEEAIHMAGKGGMVSFFAGTYPSTHLNVDPNELHYTEKEITGAFAHAPYQFEDAVKLMEMGMVDVSSLISHVLPLSDTVHGFQDTLQAVGLKKVVDPWL